MKCCTTCGSDSDKGAVIEYERLRHELTMEFQEAMKTIKEARADNEEQLRELRSIRDIVSRQNVQVISRPSGDTTTASVSYDDVYKGASDFSTDFDLIDTDATNPDEIYFDPSEIVWVDPRTVSWKKTFGHNSVVYQVGRDGMLGSEDKFYITAVGFPTTNDRSHLLIGTKDNSGSDATKLEDFKESITTTDDVFYVGMQRKAEKRLCEIMKINRSPTQLTMYWEKAVVTVKGQQDAKAARMGWINSVEDVKNIERSLIQLDLERGENYFSTIDTTNYYVVADYGASPGNNKIHYYKVKKSDVTITGSVSAATDNDLMNRTERYMFLEV